MADYENLNPFKPGQSGNPNGRPKGSRNRSTIVKELLEALHASGLPNVEVATAAIVKKALDGDVVAWEKLMDSGYGKVKDVQQLEGADGAPLTLGVTFVGKKD